MPDLGRDQEGVLARWHVSEGDELVRQQAFFEIIYPKETFLSALAICVALCTWYGVG